jgi:AraC family carnitine catabolism transcriptional activator
MKTETIKAGMLLLPNFSNLELGLVVEPLFIANWLTQTDLFSWHILSPNGGQVLASNQMSHMSNPISMLEIDYDILFVFASFEPRQHSLNRSTLNWIRKLYKFGAEVVGVETGSEVLAAAGLLNGKSVAVHWDNLTGFQELYPTVNATSQLFTIESRVMTSAGATSTLDLLLSWMEKKIGQAITKDVTRHLLKKHIANGNDQQLKTEKQWGVGPYVEIAIKLMTENLENPLSCDVISKKSGLSRRQLERQFRQQMSTTPGQYYIALRLDNAHRLLQQTDLPVTDIALQSGFQSPEHFSRIYRHRFGRAPSNDRLQSVDSPVMFIN